MYEDLLPNWDPYAGVRGRRTEDGPSAANVLDALKRSAVIAGQREEGLVSAMHVAWTALVAPHPPEEIEQAKKDQGWVGGGVLLPARDKEKKSLDDAVRALSHHLEVRIRRRGPRMPA